MNRVNATTAPAADSYLLGLRIRGAVLMVFCLLTLGTILVRLAWVQTYYPERVSSLRCFRNSRTGPLPAPRGRILDVEGRALADNRFAYTLFVNPSRVPDESRDDLARMLRDSFGCDLEAVGEALQDARATRRILIPEMSAVDLDRFEDLANKSEYSRLLQEVGIWRRETRVYPLGPLAGPIIGFTASRDDGQVGLWGLESRYDDVLAGRPGAYEDLRDQRGNRIPGSRREIEAPRSGSDVILTLDADVQALAETALANGIGRTGAVGGVVIITEPGTGEIRALASRPACDPSRFREYLTDEEALFPRSTSLSFESGSAMKVFTIAAGLEEGVVQRDSILHVTTGRLPFRGGTVPDHEYGPPDMSLRDIVVHSCNRGAALVAVGLGRNRMIDWLRRFGFGQQTALAMPGEPAGNLKEGLIPLPEIDLANMGFGQGIAVTPLQLAQATSVFANGGMLVPLSLVRGRLDSPWGYELRPVSVQPRRVLDPATVEIIQDFMVGVVEEGTAVSARTEWQCAGKTGTAQKVSPEGKYYDNRFYATFVGYGPVPDPQWLIVVILDEPHYPYFGGAACGPVFREIFNALMLREGEIAHDETEPVQPMEIPPLEAETWDENLGAEVVLGEYVLSSDPFEDESSEN